MAVKRTPLILLVDDSVLSRLHLQQQAEDMEHVDVEVYARIILMKGLYRAEQGTLDVERD